MHTTIVDIFFALRDPLAIYYTTGCGLFPHVAPALTEYYNLMSWNVVLFDGFANYLFADTVRIDIGGIPGVDATVICCLQKR